MGIGAVRALHHDTASDNGDRNNPRFQRLAHAAATSSLVGHGEAPGAVSRSGAVMLICLVLGWMVGLPVATD
jgi:hypothetical protein